MMDFDSREFQVTRAARPGRAEQASDTPRILAIADVRIYAPWRYKDEMADFYGGIVGLDLASSGDDRLEFRAFPRSGARLIVDFQDPPPERPWAGNRLSIQVASLYELADLLDDRRCVYEWSHGWYFYDRRLVAIDPVGYRVELITSHPL